jgi:uncharacterized protein YjbI with pentapeptide repeats
MSSQVVAAVIAASVSFLTLIGTLVAQYFGRRATSRDTQKTLEQQGKHLDRTLSEQREQLDRTLAEQRTRTLNERFATAASQLGDDKPAAVRLAGVYAMSGLADDWEDNRQTCVDILCGYLRMPYDPYPGDDASRAEQTAYRANREVRHTIIRLIGAHLRQEAAVSWQGLNLDFRGAVFDGGNFDGAILSSGKVSFFDAIFSAGTVRFDHAQFCGAEVDFGSAQICGGKLWFGSAKFSSGEVGFDFIELSAGSLVFDHAEFSGSEVNFLGAEFSGGTLSCGDAAFSHGRVWLGAKFCGATVWFGQTRFSGGQVWFSTAEFSSGQVVFNRALFSGSELRFTDATFSGGKVDFSGAADWSQPPRVDWGDSPPAGVALPIKSEASHPGIKFTQPVILRPREED